jgi:hypothetical protein
LSFIFISQNLFQTLLHLVSDIVSTTNVSHQLGEDMVVRDNTGELREVPGEPLSQSHTEGVDVFVHLLDQGDRLDDWLVLTIHISCAFLTGVLMSQTQLGTLDVIFLGL